MSGTNCSLNPVVTRISGPIVSAIGMEAAQMYEVVQVGELGLIGEVVKLKGAQATIQVYEETTMLRPGAPVQRTGAPLSVWLGPGLIGNIYDGIQRPLKKIQARSGPWIQRGEKMEPIDTTRQWKFEPRTKVGDAVTEGTSIGEIQETELVTHRVMIPPGKSGSVLSIVPGGNYTINDPVAVIETADGPWKATMLQQWSVRVPRPIRARLRITQPLITGQRIIDTFFPIGKGGVAAIPGGFGTGKTITQHQLAKWSDAEIVVFIGCGERGNEMTEVLREFPQLKDPRTGRPLMERTILIANTSNMPVAAREISIYTGITLAEFYRDMGYNVAVFADSTSRWAEALRELAARLEEMPAEEGFPATLATRLAQFYERGGAVTTLGGNQASVSIVGAVSPPGGDFSEPVTQHTRRFIRCFWALDTELANARHFPSIHWLRSYSEYVDDVSQWWDSQASDWRALRTEALTLLQREERLQQIVKLVGPDVLPEEQRLILFVAELIKDGFLMQNSFDDKDMYCTPERQMILLRIILMLYRRGRELLTAGISLARIRTLQCVPQILRAKSTFGNSEIESLAALERRVQDELRKLTESHPLATGAK
jgi:V/A-type H+-transporting ATPase subunit A